MYIEIATWSNGDQWEMRGDGFPIARRMFTEAGETPLNIMDCEDLSLRNPALDAFWSIARECKKIAGGGNSGGQWASHYASDFWAQKSGEVSGSDPRIATIRAAT